MRTTNGTRASQELSRLEADLPRIAASLRFTQVQLDKLTLPEDLFAKNSAPLPEAALLVPLVVAEERGGYLILDGCKRYLAMRAQCRPACACGVVKAPVSAPRAGLLRIMLNRGRNLDIGERVLFYQWLADRGFGDGTKRLLGLDDNDVHDFQNIISCHDDVIAATSRGRINVRNAADFNLLDERDRSAYLMFFDGLKLSLQTEREFLEWLPETASTRGIEVRDILALQELSAIKCNTTLNDPQKIQKIRASLHSLRYPRFDAALKQWNALAQKINPDPSSIHFVPGRFFEKDRLDIRVTASKPDQAINAFESLREISREEWSQLIRPPGTSGT